MHRFLKSLLPRRTFEHAAVANVNRLRAEWAERSDEWLRELCHGSEDRDEVVAAAAIAARRALALEMFDVQIAGALELCNGRIVEMQTGEGKTLAAVPAVIWYAKAKQGVHVMTVNDYLARRDARWMVEFTNASVSQWAAFSSL